MWAASTVVCGNQVHGKVARDCIGWQRAGSIVAVGVMKAQLNDRELVAIAAKRLRATRF